GLILIGGGLMAQDEADKSLTLKLGDPRWKGKTLEVAAGEIFSAETGKAIPFAQMIKEMRPAAFVHVGETHNSLPIHELQAKIIQALHEQDRHLAIGLEMYPVTRQEPLTKWSLGILTEAEFIKTGKWYTTWNQNFAYYRPIFDLAKASGVPMYALNAPREIISKIRTQGWEALTDAEKAIVPEPDLSLEEHRQLIRTIFESTPIPEAMKGPGLEKMFEGLYRSQAAWDEVMASNAVRVHNLEGRKVVVLVGSGHLLYNLGLNKRAYDRSKRPFKTVVAVAVPKDKPRLPVARGLSDYIVGIAEEERPAYPSIGLSFKTFAGLENLVVDAKPIDGAALGQDFEKGDIVLDVEGTPYTDANDLRTFLARFGYDAEIKFRLLRAGAERTVVLKIRPQAAPPAEKK
ncbi:MAG: hypothetical protein FJY82_10315, partial [Candidatus Aminicenantes bacterium]|nr:hypothetical protein [Candidatus Aminicenantes bacterium]